MFTCVRVRRLQHVGHYATFDCGECKHDTCARQTRIFTHAYVDKHDRHTFRIPLLVWKSMGEVATPAERRA